MRLCAHPTPEFIREGSKPVAAWCGLCGAVRTGLAWRTPARPAETKRQLQLEESSSAVVLHDLFEEGPADFSHLDKVDPDLARRLAEARASWLDTLPDEDELPWD